MNKIQKIYELLLEKYGNQGWWPLLELNNSIPVSITKSGSLRGYHPADYSYPNTENQLFEVCIGAIATQNTSWIQVEKALTNLNELHALDPEVMKELDIDKLKEAIKPAGYFNQKAKKMKIFTDFFLSLDGRAPTRDELLSVWGIGRETADSIMLYAYKQPEFVVDVYTKRIFSNLGIIDGKAEYHEIKALFEKNLQRDVVMYQEYHALLVEHAKRYYNKKPYGEGDFLKSLIL